MFKVIDKAIIQQQLAHTIDSVDIANVGEKFEGKVRDCYLLGDRRVLITSDRLSAFDVVLTTIPFKGQVLSQLASYWFSQTENIIPNHLISTPHPNVMVTKEVEILPVEIVVRGYITGSAWRDYEAGKAVSGIELPKGLAKSSKFPEPLITPSTKAEKGEHDMPISSEEVVSSGLVDKDTWNKVCDIALRLFDFGTTKAAERGLILVDTKYEMGLVKNSSGGMDLVLADEVHTPDSSRYWLSDSYEQRFSAGENPEMLDKEFVRGWLIEQGYMGEGTPPSFPDEFRVETASRYIRLYEQVTGEQFVPQIGAQEEIIAQSISSAV